MLDSADFPNLSVSPLYCEPDDALIRLLNGWPYKEFPIHARPTDESLGARGHVLASAILVQNPLVGCI